MKRRCAVCGKKQYRTFIQAVGVALKQSLRSGIALRIYCCPVAKGWHLTKQPKRGIAA